jgi:hypothetical protein
VAGTLSTREAALTIDTGTTAGVGMPAAIVLTAAVMLAAVGLSVIAAIASAVAEPIEFEDESV